MNTLEDLEAGMDSTCMSILGDSITYRPASGPTIPIKAYGNFEDLVRSLDAGQAIEQDMLFEVLRSDVPVRPTLACRITARKLPGKIFQPVNVSLDRSGTHWQFELKRVNA